MSLIEDLAAHLTGIADALPEAELAAALDRLRTTTAVLAWVRTESSQPLGVPQLSGAVEHLEHAGRALLAARDALERYLAAIGIGVSGGAPPAPAAVRPPAGADQHPDAPRGGHAAPPGWWVERVAQLTDGPVPATAGTATRPRLDSRQLLREVARHTRRDDRTALREELAAVPAPVGLGLSALAPPVLHQLATDLLGHPPRAADLPVLQAATGSRVGDLLPRLPPAVVDTMLARVCRMPPPRATGTPPAPHPADVAVAGAVLAGVLLHRLGRDPQAMPGPDGPRPATAPQAPADTPPAPAVPPPGVPRQERHAAGTRPDAVPGRPGTPRRGGTDPTTRGGAGSGGPGTRWPGRQPAGGTPWSRE